MYHGYQELSCQIITWSQAESGSTTFGRKSTKTKIWRNSREPAKWRHRRKSTRATNGRTLVLHAPQAGCERRCYDYKSKDGIWCQYQATSDVKQCINECIFTGPPLQPLLWDIMVRARVDSNIVLADLADIQKALIINEENTKEMNV